MHSMQARSTALVCAAALAACSSSTVIRSNPPGARVFIDGMYVGQTPYVMSDTKIVGSSTSVRLEYPGLPPVATTIQRTEEFDATACIGGVFFLVPFLWIAGYRPEHFYELAAMAPPQPYYPPQGGYPPPQGGPYAPPPPPPAPPGQPAPGGY